MANTVAPTKDFAQVFSATGASIGSSGSPATSSSVKIGQANIAEVYVTYVQASLTQLTLTWEASQDNSTWFKKIDHVPTALTASATNVYDVPVAHQYLRVKLFGTGTPNSSDSVTIAIGSGAV